MSIVDGGRLVVDYNLFIAEKLCLIGGRHLIIASSDPVSTERALQKINRDVLKLQAETEVQYMICDARSSVAVFDEVLDRETGRFKQSDSSKTVLVIRGLERTSKKVQVMLLDIIRRKEKTAVADEVFFIIAIVESIQGNELCLYRYLQDKFWFRHPHLLDVRMENIFEDSSSAVSSISSDAVLFSDSQSKIFSTEENQLESILQQRTKIKYIAMIPEIKRYMLDIIVFIRNHRIVMDGIPTRFIADFDLLIRCLAIINEYEYVTPTVVKLAARKFFPLKINLCNYEDEPSLNWGSDINLVKLMVQKWNADLVVEDVLNRIRAPT